MTPMSGEQQSTTQVVGPDSRQFRIAFLTPEFVTTSTTSGGLASYLGRFVTALKDRGHDPEIFVLGPPGVDDFNGVRVESVNNLTSFSVRAIRKLARIVPGVRLERSVNHLVGAWALARAFERRQHDQPFDVVQSSNYGLTGLFIRRNGRRPLHFVRCSSSRRLWKTVLNKRLSLDFRLMDNLERRLIAKADFAYAPSKFLADYFREQHSLDVHRLRPPLDMSLECAETVPWELPARYLIHFGLLGARKGTDVVVDALEIVFKEEPNFRMVFAGNEAELGIFTQLLERLGPLREKVLWLGSVARTQLYSVVAGAVASVLPSRVDNLPNTAIESLTLGTPVIGSDGASINELVDDGRNGLLVPIGDSRLLAHAMLDAWRQTPRWSFASVQESSPTSLFDQRDPVEEFCSIVSASLGVSAETPSRIQSY
jgi:glycosyltransferase involved in cell wall biosynthesis